MDIFRFKFNRLEENTMVVTGAPGRCVLVDPAYDGSAERAALMDCIDRKGLTVEAVLVTHGHMDHLYGVADIQKTFGVPVYMSPLDLPVMQYFQRAAKFGLKVNDPDFEITPVEDGSVVRAAGLEFKVIATPGHSPGGVCYLEEDEQALFTGDTLFAGAIGRTDFYLGDYDALIRSIMEKLMILPGDVAIYPGHGPASTIGSERFSNPFLEPFNEKEEPYDEN